MRAGCSTASCSASPTCRSGAASSSSRGRRKASGARPASISRPRAPTSSWSRGAGDCWRRPGLRSRGGGGEGTHTPRRATAATVIMARTLCDVCARADVLLRRGCRRAHGREGGAKPRGARRSCKLCRTGVLEVPPRDDSDTPHDAAPSSSLCPTSFAFFLPAPRTPPTSSGWMILDGIHDLYDLCAMAVIVRPALTPPSPTVPQCEEVRGCLNVPTLATAFVSKSFLPHMRARGTGSLVIVQSPISRAALPGATAYSTARYALRGWDPPPSPPPPRTLSTRAPSLPPLSALRVLPHVRHRMECNPLPRPARAGCTSGSARTWPAPTSRFRRSSSPGCSPTTGSTTRDRLSVCRGFFHTLASRPMLRPSRRPRGLWTPSSAARRTRATDSPSRSCSPRTRTCPASRRSSTWSTAQPATRSSTRCRVLSRLRRPCTPRL